MASPFIPALTGRWLNSSFQPKGYAAFFIYALFDRTSPSQGPDAYDYYEQGQFGVARTRPNIIDRERSNHPIHNGDRSIWVVFNGEISSYVSERYAPAAGM